MCSTFYTGTKWLKDLAAHQEQILGKVRDDAYGHFSNTLERVSYDCYIAARMEFGTATREVRTPSRSFQLCSIFIATLF